MSELNTILKRYQYPESKGCSIFGIALTLFILWYAISLLEIHKMIFEGGVGLLLIIPFAFLLHLLFEGFSTLWLSLKKENCILLFEDRIVFPPCKASLFMNPISLFYYDIKEITDYRKVVLTRTGKIVYLDMYILTVDGNEQLIRYHDFQSEDFFEILSHLRNNISPYRFDKSSTKKNDENISGYEY